MSHYTIRIRLDDASVVNWIDCDAAANSLLDVVREAVNVTLDGWRVDSIINPRGDRLGWRSREIVELRRLTM